MDENFKLPNNAQWSQENVCYIESKFKHCLELEDVNGNIVEMKCRNYFPNKEYWVNKVFEHYREVGFPYPKMTDSEIWSAINKLKSKDSKECAEGDLLKNSGSLCLDVTRHFCADTYWKCSGETTPSIYDSFMNDESLMKVLKNRMGFIIGKSPWSEDGKTYYHSNTPYCFDMDDAMLFQGFRSSMIGFATSNFKPIIAKYLIERYCPENGVVGDYSCGWIARALGAWSCGRSYRGIDPATAKYVNDFAQFVGADIKAMEGGSEDPSSYNDVVDYWLSSPPYFNLEIYEGGKQSIQSFNNYDLWLNNYWKPTVHNCVEHLKDNGKFTLVMLETFDKHDILEDMTKIMEEEGLTFVEDLRFKTSRSHLTKSAGNTKNSEVVRTMTKTR